MGNLSRTRRRATPGRNGAVKRHRSIGSSVREKIDRGPLRIPHDRKDWEVDLKGQHLRLTNLQKPFWPELGVTKGDLLQYYADMAAVLLPHLANRAMVMKRYPNGAGGDFFFMKHAPRPRPAWLQICSIEHDSGNIVDFPVVQDLASLLYIVNLGCIDLNQWYAACDDVDRPDYLHFDLDPVDPAGFEKVRDAALIVHEALDELGIPNFAKTTGSRGIHIYVPIVRGPHQKDVLQFAKELAWALAERHPDTLTAEYRIAKRPPNRVLVDYNQNAWGRTLASVYSVRPKPQATVSTPVTWEEVANGTRTEDFRIDNVRERVRRVGDLWRPLLARGGRCRLEHYISTTNKTDTSRRGR